MSRSFTVIVDTQEKQPYELNDPKILEVKYKKLKTGDYSIEGMESIFCIERKKSVAELSVNVHQKRFHRELERLKQFKYKYLLLEAGYTELINFPHHSNLPPKVKKKIKVSGPYLSACLIRMQVKYDLNIIFCGNRENATRIAINIMKEVVEQNG